MGDIHGMGVISVAGETELVRRPKKAGIADRCARPFAAQVPLDALP